MSEEGRVGGIIVDSVVQIYQKEAVTVSPNSVVTEVSRSKTSAVSKKLLWWSRCFWFWELGSSFKYFFVFWSSTLLFQMTVPGSSGYYPEYVIGDPTLQSHSPNGQALPNIPAELMPEMTFPQPEVYDHPIQALPQYLSSSLPQHQNLITPMSQPHPSVALPPPHPPLPASAPSAAYGQGSLIYIDGERESNQMM